MHARRESSPRRSSTRSGALVEPRLADERRAARCARQIDRSRRARAREAPRRRRGRARRFFRDARLRAVSILSATIACGLGSWCGRAQRPPRATMRCAVARSTRPSRRPRDRGRRARASTSTRTRARRAPPSAHHVAARMSARSATRSPPTNVPAGAPEIDELPAAAFDAELGVHARDAAPLGAPKKTTSQPATLPKRSSRVDAKCSTRGAFLPRVWRIRTIGAPKDRTTRATRSDALRGGPRRASARR